MISLSKLRKLRIFSYEPTLLFLNFGADAQLRFVSLLSTPNRELRPGYSMKNEIEVKTKELFMCTNEIMNLLA